MSGFFLLWCRGAERADFCGALFAEGGGGAI